MTCAARSSPGLSLSQGRLLFFFFRPRFPTGGLQLAGQGDSIILLLIEYAFNSWPPPGNQLSNPSNCEQFSVPWPLSVTSSQSSDDVFSWRHERHTAETARTRSSSGRRASILQTSSSSRSSNSPVPSRLPPTATAFVPEQP